MRILKNILVVVPVDEIIMESGKIYRKCDDSNNAGETEC
jgi:hypothetical protein